MNAPQEVELQSHFELLLFVESYFAHNMAVLCFVLIFAGLTGIHSITTVSEVSVKAGGSVSIPCLYEYKYRNNVKYLCEGYDWLLCKYRVKTNEPKQSSRRFLISDDKQRQVFTVKINDLKKKENYYWCAVEINDGPDKEKFFQVSVTTETPRLYVDHQEMTGFIGEDLTINCYYRLPGKIQWCRLGGSCVKEQSGSIDGTRVTITDNFSVFTVTMRGLRMESSGWYFCAKGDLQMPVHVTVKQRPTTTITHLSTAPSTADSTTKSQFITSLLTTEAVNYTSASASEELTTVHRGYHSNPHSFIILLSVFIVLVIVTTFICIIWKRCMRVTRSSTTATTEEDVTYTTVMHRRKPVSKSSCAESDETVTYSSVAAMKQQTV